MGDKVAVRQKTHPHRVAKPVMREDLVDDNLASRRGFLRAGADLRFERSSLRLSAAEPIRLTRGISLAVILLSSFGLWAAIWTAVAATLRALY